MSLTLLNNVAETTVTTGTGAYLLAGVVSAGYRPFGDGGNGAVIPYKVENGDKTKSEWGYGTYDSGDNTLARTTIVGNYLGTTAAIDWAAGTKNIYSPAFKEFSTWATFNNSGDVSAVTIAESSAPSTPASGFVSVYAKTDGKLYLKDDAGTETDLTAGSTLDSLSDVVITSPASGQLIRHNGTNWVNASLATAGIQPLDATLTAFAALTIAANSLTLGTGADAFSQTTFAANTFPARASSGSLEAKTISDFALTCLDDSDAAAFRATIGAGTGSGDALIANTLDQFADVTQTSGKTLAITDNTTLGGGSHSGTNTGDQNTFATISVSGQSDVVADGTSDTLTLVAGTNITITTNAGSDSITITATGNALTSNPLSQFASTTSAELASTISDETGSGSLVFNDGPRFLTSLSPVSGEVVSLGVSARPFSSLFLDTGGAVDFNNGDVTITHTSNKLDVDGGVVDFGSTPTVNNAAVYYDGGTDVAVTDGGTGASSASGARVNLLPSLSGNALKILRVNAGETDYELATAGGGSGDMLGANNLSDVASATTSATNLGLGTGSSPQFTAVNVGHATDTTLARASAGVLSVEGNTIYAASGTDVALADGGTGASLTDPNADRILFWDDSAGAVTWLEAGSGLTITGTTMTASGGGGATTALDNLASVAINTSLVLGTSDGGALGSVTKMWSDLFLASGAVVNFDNSDVTVTHAANTLTFSGASSGVRFQNSIAPSTSSGPTLGLSGTNTWNALYLTSAGVIDFGNGDITLTNSNVNELVFAGAVNGWKFSEVVVPATNDAAALGTTSLMWSDLFLASGAVVNFNNGDVTVTHSANTLAFAGAASGYTFTGGPVVPATNDAAALGTTSLMWSDLFLATGAVINFNNGNAAITHSSGILTVSTGDFRVTTAGTNTASCVTVGGTQTLTNKTLTAPKLASGGFIADANGNEGLIFTTTASAVNEITLTNAATAGHPSLKATGGDTNIGLLLAGKGTGKLRIGDGADNTKLLTIELVGATTAKTMTLTSSHTDNRTITLPNATDTLVGKDTVDILTNKVLRPPVQSVTTSATVTPNADADRVVDITAQAADLTIANPSGSPGNGQVLMIRIKDNGTARALTWGSGYTICGTTLPTTTVVSKRLACLFVYNTANSLNKWELLASNQEA